MTKTRPGRAARGADAAVTLFNIVCALTTVAVAVLMVGSLLVPFAAAAGPAPSPSVIGEPLRPPALIGDPRPTLRALVVVPAGVRAPDGVQATVTAKNLADLGLLLDDAAADLSAWSSGGVRIAFDVRSFDAVLPLSPSNGRLWPDPASASLAAQSLSEAPFDVIVVYWSQGFRPLVDYAGLAGGVPAWGSMRSLISLPAPEWGLGRHPGEGMVHELCHALELFARIDGPERINLHHPERYGFAAGRDGSWAAWYRFFLTHPTVEAADATGLRRAERTVTPERFVE
jgi:hypothetical protein